MVLTTQYHAELRIGDLREAVVKHSYLLIQLSRRFALSIDDLSGSLGDEVLVGELRVDAVKLLLSGGQFLVEPCALGLEVDEVAHGDVYLGGIGNDADCAVYLNAVLNLDLGRARELLHKLDGEPEGVDMGGADIYFSLLGMGNIHLGAAVSYRPDRVHNHVHLLLFGSKAEGL